MNQLENRLGKAYAIDATINLMTDISGCKPSFFQRDGSLYLVSERGFAKYQQGLVVAHEGYRGEIVGKDLPETKASENIIVSKNRDSNEKTKFIAGEKEFIKPLIFHEDSSGAFNLKSMQVLAQQLKELKDDGKIRMINHSHQYHSHKHGYAADGADTWIGDARVMPLDTYLEIVRSKEDEFHHRFRNVANQRQVEGVLLRSTSEPGEGRLVRIPDVMLITPEIIFTFPRVGRLDNDDKPKGWNENTNLGTKNQSPFYEGVTTSSSEQHPFSSNLTINMQNHEITNQYKFAEYYKGLVGELQKQLGIIDNNIIPIHQFVRRMNATHKIGTTRAYEEYEEEERGRDILRAKRQEQFSK